MTKQTQSKDRPETIRDGNLKASIFRNESEKGTYHTTTLARTYQDDQGNLRDTHSFSKNDLLKVSELARSAYNRINELKREQSQSRDEGREAFREKRQSRNDQNRDAPSRDY